MITDNEESPESLCARIEDQAAAIVRLNERIAELEDECSNLEGEAEELREQRDSLESDIEEVEAERDDLALQLSSMDSRVEQLDAERCDFDCPRCATGEVPSTAAQWTGTGETVSLEEAFDER